MDDIAFFGNSFLELGWASKRSAWWIRSLLNQSVTSLSKLNIFAESSLGIAIVGDGSSDITVKVWSEVVVDIVCLVSVLLPAFWCLEGPLLSDHFGGDSFVGESVCDVVVLAEVWDWIVSWWFGSWRWVLVLATASGGADWV